MSTARRHPAARRLVAASATALLLAGAATTAAAQVRPVADRPLADRPAAPRLLASAPGAATESAAAPAPRAEAARLELVGAPDTLRLADLKRGHPLLAQLVGVDGRPVEAPVRWRVLAGDVALTITDGHTRADGFAQATLGRAPWLFARPGVATVEVSTTGAAAPATTRHTVVLVR